MFSLFEVLSGFMALSPFTLKLVVGQLSFAAHFRQKERFLLRLIVSFLLQLTASVGLMAAFRGIDLWQIQNTLYYCLLFALSAAWQRFRARTQLWPNTRPLHCFKSSFSGRSLGRCGCSLPETLRLWLVTRPSAASCSSCRR